MEVVGKIIQVLPAQEGVGRNGNPWKVQPYVLETLDQYPRKVHFEVFGEDRIKQNPCDVDQLVTVSFDIESREFNVHLHPRMAYPAGRHHPGRSRCSFSTCSCSCSTGSSTCGSSGRECCGERRSI